jgi:IS1 family transposase
MKEVDREFMAWWIYDDIEREIFSVDFGIRHVRVGRSLMRLFARDIVVVLY